MVVALVKIVRKEVNIVTLNVQNTRLLKKSGNALKENVGWMLQFLMDAIHPAKRKQKHITNIISMKMSMIKGDFYEF